MHRFLVTYVEDGIMKQDILALVKEIDWENTNIKGKFPVNYRFVNLVSDSLLPNKFRNPAAALKWLDSLNIEWEDIT